MSGMRRSMLMSSKMCKINVIAANTSLHDAEVIEGDSYSTQIVVDAGYSIYEITIKMGGVDITSTAYDPTYNMITIPSVTGDVDIECYAMHSMPSDYVRVDGIKNPSNAWMDTGYTFSGKNAKVEIDVYLTDTMTTIIGSRERGNNDMYGTGFRGYNDNICYYKDKALTSWKGWSNVSGKRVTLVQDHYFGYVSLDGAKTTAARTSGAVDRYTLGLFGVSNVGGSTVAKDYICYSLKIYDYSSNSYVRYYIPCLNASGVAGFWDAARGVFQGSSNSTAFEAVAADGGDFRLIDFEDSAVKNICVTNWGGHYKAGEMYTPEARAVTSFGNKFEQNKEIVKFNEMQYFTGLTTLSRYVSSQYFDGMHFFGAFNRCSNLEEITLPTISITGDSCIATLFARCPKLKTVDMSPITVRSITYLYGICKGNTAMISVILPNVSTASSYLATMYAFSECSNLTTIDASRVNFANQNYSNDASSFSGCAKLTRIIGGLSGFRQTETTIKAAPLTHDAAVELLESLGTVTSARTITLKTSTYNTLTAEELAIATDKGWTVAKG